nr:spike protein [Rousettus bat coronavirus]
MVVYWCAMLLIVLLSATAALASRPQCFTGVTLEPKTHVINYTSVSINPANLLLPDPYIAYAGQTLRQNLFMADMSRLILYPITPPSKDANSGYSYNTTILNVTNGFFVHTWMYKQSSTSPVFCQEPFGVAFGTTFENDRIAIIVIAPDKLGSWIHASYRTQTTVHILVCSNATLCANPGFNRWGPAGNIIASDALVDHDKSCFVNNSFTVNVSTSRLNLAFLFKDGDLLVYHSNWLPSGVFDYNGSYPLQYFMSLPVGANLPRAQFFQSIVRKGGANNGADGQCVNFDINLHVAHLVSRDLLVSYFDNGTVAQAADCANSASQELFCVTGSFNPPTGVYPLSRYRAQVAGYIHVTQQGDQCDPPYVQLQEPPQPIVWKRFMLRNCAFDFGIVMENLPTYRLQCSGISPSRLMSMCYSSVTIDTMRINSTHLNNLLTGVPDAFSTYNYALPKNFYGCIHAYYLNVTGAYAVASQNRIAPGGRQSNIYYINTVLESAKYIDKSLLFGLTIITLKPSSGNKLVCPLANDTAVIVDKCVQFNLYGYTGTGVLSTNTSLSIPNGKVFTASSTGSIIGVLINGTTYSIKPCVTVPVSVGYHANYQRVLLFNGLSCDQRAMAVTQPASSTWTAAALDTSVVDTPSGCVLNAIYNNETIVNTCTMPLGNSLCLINSTLSVASANSLPQLRLVTFDPLYNNLSATPITPVYWVQIPTNFTLSATDEYIQTTSPKVTIDCARYLCGDSSRCLDVLLHYGTFCDDINKALSKVSSILDGALLSLAKELAVNTRDETVPVFSGDYNFTGLMGCLGPQCSATTYRSAFSDLLYDKVKITDPGFMQSYQKCIDSQWGGSIRDLLCTQTYNGIAVLPPIVSPAMQALYTSLLVGAVASSGYTFGITSAGVIPFATQLQFRLNGIGVTTQVLVENQKLIASSFNNALVNIQKGFTETSIALTKMQDVINQHASQLQTLVTQLGNSFGAISSSINEIFSRLEGLAANAEVDRLINGRMMVLNTYVTQLLIQASEARAQNALAMQKISECVKAQSLRNDFCGNGTHVLSIPQLAPNGVLFIHYSYTPTEYALVQTSAGLCYNGTGYAPVRGMFVLPNNSNLWHFTSMQFYNPVNVSKSNTQVLSSCSINYTSVNYTVLQPDGPSDFNFDQQFDKFYKNLSAVFNNTFNPNDFNFSMVDVTQQVSSLRDVVSQLNQSFIDLKKLNVYEKTIKWPWYVWLAMIAGIVGLVLAVIMLMCMTNCCSCFKGMCDCRRCCGSYDSYDDVYPAVRVNKKRTV